MAYDYQRIRTTDQFKVDLLSELGNRMKEKLSDPDVQTACDRIMLNMTDTIHSFLGRSVTVDRFDHGVRLDAWFQDGDSYVYHPPYWPVLQVITPASEFTIENGGRVLRATSPWSGSVAYFAGWFNKDLHTDLTTFKSTVTAENIKSPIVDADDPLTVTPPDIDGVIVSVMINISILQYEAQVHQLVGEGTKETNIAGARAVVSRRIRRAMEDELLKLRRFKAKVV